MKRVLLLILAAVILLSLASCNQTGSNSSTASDTVSENKSPQSIATAKALIKEGKYAEAYAALYPDRENAEVKAMLEGFLVAPTRTDYKSYLSYNYVRETEYNEHGDVIRRCALDQKYSYGETVCEYEYVYDENGNMLKKTEKDSWYDTVTVTEYEYDSQNRLVKIINEDKTTEYAYDDAGNIAKETVLRGTDNVSETLYTYDEFGNVLSESEYFNGEFSRSHSYTYVYNDHNDIVSTDDSYSTVFNGETITNEAKSTCEYTYDSLGRAIKTVSEGNAGKNVKEFEYNDNGDVVKETVNTIAYTTVSEYEYTYSNGKITKERMVQNTWSNDFLDEEYDDRGNITMRKSDGSLIKHEYVYDKNGFIIKETLTTEGDDYYGKTSVTIIEYTNDEQGRVLKSVSVDEKGKANTKEYTYDSDDRILKETWTESYGEYNNTYYIDEYTYDDNGNVLTNYHKYHDSESTTTYKYVYDKNGNVLEKKSGDSVTKYAYDEKGNSTKIERYTKSAISEWTENTYDEKGNITKSVKYDADGAVIAVRESVFDDNGNLTSESLKKGNSETDTMFEEYVHNYTYDPLGNMLTYFEMRTDISGTETAFCEYTYSGYTYYYKAK